MHRSGADQVRGDCLLFDAVCLRCNGVYGVVEVMVVGRSSQLWLQRRVVHLREVVELEEVHVQVAAVWFAIRKRCLVAVTGLHGTM